MTTGNCEDCGRWDSSLDTGVCPECKRRYQAYGLGAQVIGIAGPAGVGKDTAADYLVGQLPQYRKVAFADPLKEMLRTGLSLDAAQLYGNDKETIDHRYECSPRHIMQTLGTEWGRQLIHPDIWVRALAARIGAERVVISDVRFQNEADFVRERGILIHLTGRGGIGQCHQSELGLDAMPGDITIANDGDLKKLYGALYDAVIA